MFNKENLNHTYMSDKAAKRLAKSNEKIAKEKLEAQEKAAREERWQREMNTRAKKVKIFKSEKEITLTQQGQGQEDVIVFMDYGTIR